MFKITFLGAGSTVFAKNVLGDCILTPELGEFEIALYDIDRERLNDSELMLKNINKKYAGKATVVSYTDRKAALQGAEFVVNAIQVGGYKPCTVTDFEIPKKYGLRQTIADTLGIGGIFRALRTIPVLEGIAEDMRTCCPRALFINYTNPMAILTGYLIRELKLNTVGLCHSVQVCVEGLYKSLGLEDKIASAKSKIAGINHQAWLLEIEDENGNDMYPEIKRRSLSGEYEKEMSWDLVRHDMMHRFGYYNTESSEHTAEYNPYFIKSRYPELIDRYKIPLDEYPRRCEKQIAEWIKRREELVSNQDIEHVRSREFAAPIIRAMKSDIPYKINGNVLNTGLITNLPREACVEVPCMVDRNGVNPCYIGDLPQQLAALNRTNINVQLLTIEAARTRKKEAVYQAAYLDPHTAAELSLDDIKSLCDDLFEAHKDWLPEYH